MLLSSVCAEPKTWARSCSASEDLEWNSTRITDPDCPKGCPVPGGVLLNYKTGGAGEGADIMPGTGGHQLVGGEQSHCVSLICILLYYYHYYVPFLFCLNK